MPPFDADAPLTPKGGKHLFIMHFSSFSLRGKDVRSLPCNAASRTGWGLFKYCLIKTKRTVLKKHIELSRMIDNVKISMEIVKEGFLIKL